MLFRSLVETDLAAWWVSLKNQITSQHSLLAYRWYQYLETNTKPGPAVRTTQVLSPGTAIGAVLPLQTAATVTWRTASRKHWGRVYVPGLTATAMSSSGLGHFSSAAVDAICGAFHTLFNAVAAHTGLQVVVASRQYFGLLTISQMNMDDTPDQQRRRRPDRPTYNKLFVS